MIMNDLTQKHCIPCEGGQKPLDATFIAELKEQLKKEWEVIENKKIKQQFLFKTFKEAINFVNKVAELAETEDHHPNVFISYNKVTITLSTHAIGGLSENDFILAAKIEQLQ